MTTAQRDYTDRIRRADREACNTCACRETGAAECNDEIIRQILSRIAIFRKLKDLGHSDDTIFTTYEKSIKDN